MGIPLEVHKTDPFAEVADGYIIDKARYYLPELELEPDEIAALSIAAQAVLGSGEEAGAGLLKLSMDDEPAGLQAGSLRWGADVAAQQPALETLYSTLANRTPVSFEYESASGVKTARTVHPYGLVHRRGGWYLVAHDVDRDQLRTFKVGRVASRVEPLDGNYEIPGDFDAAKFTATQPWETGDEPVEATVRFNESLRWWVDQNMPDSPRRDTTNGELEVQMNVSNRDAFFSWFVEFGSEVEIVAPDSLREHLCTRLQPFLNKAHR
jgi:proteasome accessory factor B